ncbi:MAG: hypothetical protein Q9227_005698 [Pyrenula ochraceoflavens]
MIKLQNVPATYQAIALALIIYLASRWWRLTDQHKADEQFAIQHGCEPLKTWNAKWPMGLDLFVKAFRYAKAEQILRFFLDVVERSGTTFEQNLLGARGIDTVEPRNIEALLSTQFNDFGLGLRPPTFYPLLGSGIFTQDGAQWKHSRELLRPQFLRNRNENFEQIKECVEALLDGIEASRTVDLQPLFFRLTFDTTTFLLFGESMSALRSQDIAGRESEFADAFNLGQDYLSHRGRCGDFYWMMNPPAFRRACKTCHKFVDGAVREALERSDRTRKSDNESYIFIEALIEETKDTKVLRDQCLNILLAGRDTTACCLLWTFRLLARHPEVLSRLRAEIKSVAGLGSGSSQPTRNDLKQMSYLSMVIKEVLRLYPSVPVNSRAAIKMTTLPTGGGREGTAPILVRKGEAVGYCVYAMHRRKDLYGEDADRFRPERWEENDGRLVREIGWGYLPFNGGPRICLGQEFALLEASYTIARILQVFPNVKVPEGEPVVDIGMEKQILTLVVACGDGCRVTLERE